MSDYRPFSEREGFVSMKVYQVDTIDADTRVKIYNQIFDFLHPSDDPYDDNDLAWRADNEAWDIVYLYHFWAEFYLQPVDEYTRDLCEASLKSMLLSDDPWHRVFDFVEYLLELCTHSFEYEGLSYIYNKKRGVSLIAAINRVLEESKVGYSIIVNKFVPFLSEEEKQEVEKAFSTPFHAANQHVKKAINFLADRKNPDYENSIKESISAVNQSQKKSLGTKKHSTP